MLIGNTHVNSIRSKPERELWSDGALVNPWG